MMTAAIRGFLVTGVAAAALVAASTSVAAPTTCDGTLEPGTYTRLVVPAGATCIGIGHVTVNGNVSVGDGATFVLGAEDTPELTSTITGSVQASNPLNLQIHFTTINGRIESHGGSGPFGGPFGVTWITIEDSLVNGGVTIDGYNGFWMGFIRNHVNGSVNLNDNVLVDSDANEYVTNHINGNLKCSGNVPAPQVGDSMGSPNQVNGRKSGQCAAL
jgi:hypothetical protein